MPERLFPPFPRQDGKLHIKDRQPHAQGVHIQEGRQLIDHHGIIIQQPNAGIPPAPSQQRHAGKRVSRLLHRTPCQQWEQQISLHFNGQRPAGRTQGRGHVGICPEGEGERKMGDHIPPEKACIAIQPPGQRNCKKHQEQKGIVGRHNPCNPLPIKAPPRRIGLPLHHMPGIRKEKEEPAEQDGTVHRHIPGTYQKVQGHTADAGCPPTLLPNVVPADDEHQQHPKAIQLRNTRLALGHDCLLFPCCKQLLFLVPCNPLFIPTFAPVFFFPPAK